MRNSPTSAGPVDRTGAAPAHCRQIGVDSWQPVETRWAWVTGGSVTRPTKSRTPDRRPSWATDNSTPISLLPRPLAHTTCAGSPRSGRSRARVRKHASSLCRSPHNEDYAGVLTDAPLLGVQSRRRGAIMSVQPATPLTDSLAALVE